MSIERMTTLMTVSVGIAGFAAWALAEGVLVGWLVLRCLSVARLPGVGGF